MATTQAETRTKLAAPKGGPRLGEIVGILLLAAGLLVALCLAFFHPDDPSLNSAGRSETNNLIGPAGAYVSDLILQPFGLAGYLLPLLLFFAAWRRFSRLPLRAPLVRVAGLLVMLLAASALLALAGLPRLFDGRVEAGGFVGLFVAEGLAGVIGRVGALVVLSALGSVGLLLATNFSFAHAYERARAAFADPSGFFGTQAARFRAWREARRAAAEQRAGERRAAREESERARAGERKLRDKTPQERVAEFMRETEGGARAETPGAAAAIQRNAAAAEAESGAAPQVVSADPFGVPPPAGDDGELSPSPRRANTIDAEAEPQPQAHAATAKRTASARGAGADDEAEVAEMVRDVSVVRTEAPEESAAERRERERAEREAKRQERAAAALSNYKLPPVDFLNAPAPRHEQADEELRQLASRVAEKCKEFNVTGKIEYICPGPVVTTYEFKPDPGVKYSRVTGLVDDLCLALKAESIRIDRVPGKAHVGIEVPNSRRDNIMLREVVESRQFKEGDSKLPLALGKTIDGLNYVADLAKMPHLLIAGATGTGKSVCLNSLVVSILYKARPDEVKFIMIDPKRLELGLYADIPHLATPIITEPKRAANALKWGVAQMEARYKQLAQWGVRNIDGYNAEVGRRNLVEDFDEQGQPWKPLPYIVIIVDELADLMMTSGHEVEEAITRLAQMARAVGIHLVLATQRPSVDVITGLIKANFPSRIAFRVSSKVDSRTIIDANGAEQLLGRGDMLFLPPGTSRLVRVHGAYVDEAEIGRIVSHIKGQGEPVYDETITQSEEEASGADGAAGERDDLFEDALRICVEMKRASTSVLQRRLRIGYGRAAAILDAMEREGFIGQADGARPRPVLGKGFETVNHWDALERGDEG
jgi:DNA segregation ATPase FtsK/SpoIIIE, S-DNA-T family